MTAPSFGRIQEICFGCSEWYHTCDGWPVSKSMKTSDGKLRCHDFLTLPTVGIDGETGQGLPPSRRRSVVSPASEPVEPQSAESNPSPNPSMPTSVKPQGETTRGNGAAEPSALSTRGRATRICGCGAPLSRGRRLCDSCRTESRRRTRREYMRGYMKQRRSTAVDAGLDPPLPSTQTVSMRAAGGDLLPAGL